MIMAGRNGIHDAACSHENEVIKDKRGGKGAPAYMMRPLAMRIKSSNSSVMSELGWWIVSATVRPASAMLFSVRMIWTAIALSRPLVGSSKKSTLGEVTSSMPTDVRRFSPPEMPLMLALPIKVSLQSCSPCTPMLVSDQQMRRYSLRRVSECSATSVQCST